MQYCVLSGIGLSIDLTPRRSREKRRISDTRLPGNCSAELCVDDDCLDRL